VIRNNKQLQLQIGHLLLAILMAAFQRLCFKFSSKSLKVQRFISTSKMLAVEDEVLLEVKNHAGVITLNRPKALNSLNLNMIQIMHPVLKAWEADNNIKVIMIKGAGEKAFCAGGDVIAVTKDGPPGSKLSKQFFKEEYLLNYEIGTLKTPYVALLDGITMGGGVGLSVHGKYRVATEKMLFAMPETAIGLFPDVGGGYFLPRLNGQLGLYLALTGHRLKGRDTFHAGIATHYTSTKEIPYLEQELCKISSSDTVHEILQTYHKKADDPSSTFSLNDQINEINRIFSESTLEGIISSLITDDSEWSNKQLQILSKMSPVSMKVTMQQLIKGATMNLDEVLKMEYRISQQCCAQNDFYEGIRALLVDRDNSPNWQPSKVEDVTDQLVDSYFKPLDEVNELKINIKL